MKKLELLSKRTNIAIVQCNSTLYINNITKKRSPLFLKRYFSNENQSGGGELVDDPILLNDGKQAMVKFKQPKGTRL